MKHSVENENTRANETIRVQKKHKNFVMIDKGFIEDKRLSLKGKGILTYVLSKPDGWKVIVKDIENHCSDGEYAIYSGLNELKKYGYYKKEPVRNEKGIITHWENVIFECPEHTNPEKPLNEKEGRKSSIKSASYPLRNFPDMDNPDMDNPDMDNHDRSNIYINKTNLNQEVISIYPENPTQEEKINNINNEIDSDTIDNKEVINNKSTAEKAPDVLLKLLKCDNIPKMVADNIELEKLLKEHPDKADKIKEFYQITCDVLTNNEVRFMRISKQSTPIITVKTAFCQLERRHIEYVLECVEKRQHNIKTNARGYIMTSLFHSIRTVNYYKSTEKSAFKAVQPEQSENKVDLDAKFGFHSERDRSSFNVDDFFEKAVNKSMGTEAPTSDFTNEEG